MVHFNMGVAVIVRTRKIGCDTFLVLLKHNFLYVVVSAPD
jgi:hypothetical protein